MPILDISTTNKFDSCSNLELFSVMVYPNDEELRNQYKAAYSGALMSNSLTLEEKWELVKKDMGIKSKGMSSDKWKYYVEKFIQYLKKDLEPAFLKSGGISTLVNSPSFNEIKNQFNSNFYSGMIAGFILTYIWQISNSQIKSGGSVNKAVDLLLENYKDMATKDKTFFFNSKDFRKAWIEFRSVSHFYAAYHHWIISGQPEKWDPDDVSCFGISGFISLAEKFRLFGINHFPRAQKTSTLPPDEMWVPPENFELTEFEFDVPSLSVEEIKILKDYQAPQKL